MCNAMHYLFGENCRGLHSFSPVRNSLPTTSKILRKYARFRLTLRFQQANLAPLPESWEKINPAGFLW
ncbi:MAG: hypothetical protein WBV41_06390, partial [Terriglobales bacterium]